MKNSILNALCCAALLLVATPGLFGQAESGTIVGIVSDQAGAVVPAAKVTLVNEGTRFTRVLSTNENGQARTNFV